jgi:hypothetical protein
MGKLFNDKFDFFKTYLDAIHMHNQLRSANPEQITYMFVDDCFFEKAGIRLEVPGLEIIKSDEAVQRAQEINSSEVFICIEHAQDGLPILKILAEKKIKFHPFGGHNVGGYVYDDRICRETIESGYLQQTLHGYAKFDTGSEQDFVNLCQALLYTNHLDGDVVEIGCYRGSSGAMMLDYASKKNLNPKKFWFFDVFSGFTYPEALSSPDTVWANTHKTEGERLIGDRLKAKSGPNTVIVETNNIISDELPNELQKISVANIDVDMYEAVRAGLFRIGPLMIPGGIMICEDQGHTPTLFGARLALQEFLDSDTGKQFTCIHMTSGQAFLVRHG